MPAGQPREPRLPHPCLPLVLPTSTMAAGLQPHLPPLGPTAVPPDWASVLARAGPPLPLPPLPLASPGRLRTAVRTPKRLPFVTRGRSHPGSASAASGGRASGALGGGADGGDAGLSGGGEADGGDEAGASVHRVRSGPSGPWRSLDTGAVVLSAPHSAASCWPLSVHSACPLLPLPQVSQRLGRAVPGSSSWQPPAFHAAC